MEVQHLEPMGKKKQIKTLHNILSCVKLVLFFSFTFNFT